jgi:hypothetical protein
MSATNTLDAGRELGTSDLETVGGGVYLPFPFFPILVPVIVDIVF